MSQSPRNEEQEEDNNQAEGEISEVDSEGRGTHVGDNSSQRMVEALDEDDAEEGTDGGGHASDNEIAEEPDREPEVEELGEGDTLPVDPERACDAGIGAADEEGQQLSGGQPDAHDVGCKFVIPDGDERSAYPGTD